MRAILLAGGKGTRLKPYTTIIPKPLVPIGGEMPIMEVVIRQLAGAGFDHITIAVNHMANLIQAFFGDGSRWNIRIDYSLEERPLSTIGPLTLITDLPDNFLVMNGDILCNLDYRAFYEYHVSHKHRITVSVYKRDAHIDFGVLQYDAHHRLTQFIEKPTYHFDVSMGIYCMQRAVIEAVPRDTPYGFDHLMLDSIAQHQQVVVKPFEGLWLDIGRPEDYDLANQQYSELKQTLRIAG